jgi:hypothetical protein
MATIRPGRPGGPHPTVRQTLIARMVRETPAALFDIFYRICLWVGGGDYKLAKTRVVRAYRLEGIRGEAIDPADRETVSLYPLW